MAKKLFALLLAVLMVLSMAACNKPAPTDPPKATDPAKPTDPAPETQGPPVEITFLVPFKDQSTNWTNIEKALNEISVKEINVKVNYEFVASSSDYTQRVALECSAGTCAELVFTCNWGCNNWATALANEYLYDITDLWQQYCPDVIKQYAVKGMELAGTAGGKQFAVPNQQIMTVQSALNIQKDMAEKYGWTLTEFDAENDAHFKALEDFLAKIRDNEPDLIPYSGDNNVQSLVNFKNREKYETIWQEIIVDHSKDSFKAMYTWDRTDFDYYYSEVRNFFNKGFMHPAMASKPDIGALQNANKVVVTKSGLKPGLALEIAAQRGGKEYLIVPIKQAALLNTGLPQATMLAVSSSATEETAIAALKVINLLWANQEYFNTFLYGIEGTNYTKNADGYIVPDDTNKHDFYLNGWAYGNQFNTWIMEGQDPDIHVNTAKLNAAAKASPLLGFTADVSGFATEVANCADVRKTHELPHYGGVSDAEFKAAVDARKQALIDAGLPTILKGIQDQLDAYKAALGK